VLIDRTYARIAEGQVHALRRPGNARATPLVMLHASPASAHSLRPLMQALPETRELVAFDTPCNGQSCAVATDSPAIAEFADMLDRAADTLGLQQIALYGTHTGAHIAIEWALARPDRVEALVLDGVALFDDVTRADFLQHYAPSKLPDETGTQFHWAWHFIRDQMIFFPYYKKDAAHRTGHGTFDANILHQLTLDVLNNLAHYHKPYHAVFRHDVRNALQRLALPVQIISEDNGPLENANDALLALVQGARMERRCTTPAEKAAAISAFLQAANHA
jgi:pimeloyl-ACP methyl ester carboxylesterase